MVEHIFDTLRRKQVLATAAMVIAIAAGAAWAQQRGGAVKPLSAQDILEIQQLGSKYAYGLDTGADNGYYYANVFTADGSFGNTAGREKLAALAREGGGRLKLRGYQHIISNFIVEPTAEGRGRQPVRAGAHRRRPGQAADGRSRRPLRRRLRQDRRGLAHQEAHARAHVPSEVDAA